MNSQYIIVYNKVTVKNTDYQAHSWLNRKTLEEVDIPMFLHQVRLEVHFVVSCLSGLTAVSLAWNRQKDSFCLALCIILFLPSVWRLFSQMFVLPNSRQFSACMSRDHAVGLFSLPVFSFRVKNCFLLMWMACMSDFRWIALTAWEGIVYNFVVKLGEGVEGSDGCRLEVGIKSHKSEVAIT